jgi:hypothetical protein
MDIGTIIAGVQAIASIADAMNKAPQLTPAQAEEKKQKQVVQPSLPPTVVVVPNQTPPMGVGVPPPPPPMVSDYWSQLPPANVLRTPVWRVPPYDVRAPYFRGVPPTTEFRTPYEPSLDELYQLYFGTRW